MFVEKVDSDTLERETVNHNITGLVPSPNWLTGLDSKDEKHNWSAEPRGVVTVMTSPTTAPQSSSSSVPQYPTLSVIPGGLVPRIITPPPVVPQGPLDMRDPIPWLLPIHIKRLFRTPPAPLSLPMNIIMGSTTPQSVGSPLGEV